MPRTAAFDRDTLIDRARALFWRKGWAGTSLKDLEGALDLRPGSIYAAFGSKEGLYALALDRYAAVGAARLRHLAGQGGPLDALKANLMAVAVDGPDPGRACMLAKTLLELGPQNSPLAARASAHLTRAEQEFAALFASAQQAHEIGPQHDPQALARQYQSDLMGLRVSLERADVDGRRLAEDIARRLDALRG